jgi:hypothetical protein
MNPAARLVDVRDVAVIHVAAMLDRNTDGKRLFASAHKFTINTILASWRETFPDRKILPDFNFEKQPDINVAQEESTALLKAYEGREWYSLRETVVANVSSVL